MVPCGPHVCSRSFCLSMSVGRGREVFTACVSWHTVLGCWAAWFRAASALISAGLGCDVKQLAQVPGSHPQWSPQLQPNPHREQAEVVPFRNNWLTVPLYNAPFLKKKKKRNIICGLYDNVTTLNLMWTGLSCDFKCCKRSAVWLCAELVHCVQW